MCRLVSKSWNQRVGVCDRLWLTQCKRYCIDLYRFNADEWNDLGKENERKHSLSMARKAYYTLGYQHTNLDVIGARLFNVNTHFNYEPPIPAVNNCADVYISGRNLLATFAKQAEFRQIIDQDCKGSNVVMTMNEEIIAYGKDCFTILLCYFGPYSLSDRALSTVAFQFFCLVVPVSLYLRNNC